MTSAGLPPSKEQYEVQWRITNTDEDAYNARQLRGDFYASEGGQSRFEELSFRGIHLVEGSSSASATILWWRRANRLGC
ncbi:nucleotide-binding domain-containing protein [Bradyrhizobium elkanii]|uniref:nucleotide-binding domain-containing protein n=1 Tax=Bradyrhizobium elkanii TaxID=29448 RepID=UPI003BA9119A